MAKIIYKPMCSKCGHVMSPDKVTYGFVTLDADDMRCTQMIYPREYLCINPSECPSCGEPFDKIEIHTPRKEEY